MGLNNINFGSRQNAYVGYSREELIKAYQNDNWKSLDANNKMQLLRETAKVYSKEAGIDNVPSINQEMNSGRYGGYSGYSNSIKINLSLCDNSYQALDTLIHELNHAYQLQCIENGTGKYSAEERALLAAENGFAYAADGMSYHRQSLEIDSNNAGLGFVLGEKGNYKSDAAMVEYLQDRTVHFEAIASDYKSHRMDCNNSELRQIDKAARLQEITNDERILAENCVLGNNNSIKTELESLREEVKQNYIETAVRYEESKFSENNMMFDERKNSIFDKSEQQHQKFEQIRDAYLANQNVGIEDSMRLQLTNQVNTAMLQNIRTELNTQRAEIMEALSSYVYSHNMTRFDTEKDAYCQELSSQIRDIDQQISNCNYRENQLLADSAILAEETGYKVEPSEKLNYKEERLEAAEQKENDLMQQSKDDGLNDLNYSETSRETLDNTLDDGLDNLDYSETSRESLGNTLDDGLDFSTGFGEGSNNDLGQSHSASQGTTNTADYGSSSVGGSGNENSNNASYDV